MVDRRRARMHDDDVPFLALLHDVVSATGQLEAVGAAESGERAIEVAQQQQPDMVLMDVRMPGLGGIAAAKQIKAARPSTLVVLISSTHPDELALEPGDMFADAAVWKSELEPELFNEIWLGYHGQA
jgi:DNA-binding NarL/FixJ family response regulator